MILVLSRNAKVSERIGDVLSVPVEMKETAQQLVREMERRQDVATVIIGEDIDLPEAGAAAEQLRITDPAVSVVLIRNRVDLTVTTEAMRSGVRSVLSASDIRGLVDQVGEQERVAQAIRARIGGRQVSGHHGTTVLVYSAKGGVGKTTTSLNIAATLAEDKARTVVVVDLDLQFGDVGVAVGLSDTTKSIADLANDSNEVTLETIRRSLDKIDDNLFVLLAPPDPAGADKVTPELVTVVLSELQNGFDWVVIDSPPAFTDEILAAFDCADIQLLIATPDLPSVKNLSVATATLERIGLDKTERCVLINRFDARAGMDRSELVRAAEAISRSTNVFVLPDIPLILKSASLGYIAARGPRGERVRKAYRGLVEFIGSVAAKRDGL